MNCPNCNNELNGTEKFCPLCGTKLAFTGVKTVSKSIPLKLLPEQIGACFSEYDVAGYSSASSVIIPEGVHAIAFSENGTSELECGRHDFSDIRNEGSVSSFFTKIRNAVVKSDRGSFAIIRKSVFPSSFVFEDFSLKETKCRVGIQLFCRIKDGKSFYGNFLLDRTSLDSAAFSKKIEGLVQGETKNLVFEKTIQEIEDDSTLASKLLSNLQKKISGIYPCLEIVEVADFTLKNEGIDAIRRQAEHFEILAKQTEMARKKLQLDEEIFETQKEIEKKHREIENERRLSEIESNYMEEKTKFERSSELKSLSAEKELEQKRIQDAYDDERLAKKLEQDRNEMEIQLELLKKAQEIRKEREDAENERILKARQQQIDAENEKIRLHNELVQSFRDMSVEQIIASNPEITPEAANAFAEKFRNSGDSEKLRMMQEQKDEIRGILSEQMAMMKEIYAGQGKEIERSTHVMETTVKAVAGGMSQNQVCPCCRQMNPPGTQFCAGCGQQL